MSELGTELWRLGGKQTFAASAKFPQTPFALLVWLFSNVDPFAICFVCISSRSVDRLVEFVIIFH